MEGADGVIASRRAALEDCESICRSPPGFIDRIRRTGLRASGIDQPRHGNERGILFPRRRRFRAGIAGRRTRIEATRGIEYALSSLTVKVKPGKLTEITLPLKRWQNMARAGWHSSDATFTPIMRQSTPGDHAGGRTAANSRRRSEQRQHDGSQFRRLISA